MQLTQTKGMCAYGLRISGVTAYKNRKVPVLTFIKTGTVWASEEVYLAYWTDKAKHLKRCLTSLVSQVTLDNVCGTSEVG
jgi:hypothetical protein